MDHLVITLLFSGYKSLINIYFQVDGIHFYFLAFIRVADYSKQPIRHDHNPVVCLAGEFDLKFTNKTTKY